MPLSFNGFPSPVPDKKAGGVINSIQRFEVGWTESGTTKDISISAVDPSKTILLTSCYTNGSNADVTQWAVSLINSTTVRLHRSSSTGAGSSNNLIDVIVVEFKNVKSKQTGTVVGVDAGTNVTISSVNRSKSIEVASLYSNGTTNSSYYNTAAVQLISNTALKVKAATNNTIFWQVIEFF